MTADTSGIPARLVEFCRLLRERELVVTPGAALDAARSLEYVDVTDVPAFHAALRANLANSVDDYPVFDAAFLEFWGELLRGPAWPSHTGPAVTPDIEGPGRPPEVEYVPMPVDIEGFDPEADTRLPGGEGSASDVDLVTHKDFADYTGADIARARRIIRQAAPSLATVPSRRTQPSWRRGQVDVRRTIREARRHGGDIVRLARKRRKLRKLRVVALCDVSGSMDTYSAYMLQFLYALQNEVGGVRSYAFSTRLYDLTPLLRRKKFADMLRGLEQTIETWSGGTSIGACLAEFNAGYAPSVVSPRTVVIIISDGWERGEVETLRREMRALSWRAYRVIWMNPLKGHAGYQPLASGMAAALPFVDHFLPANTIESFERLKRTLVGLG